MELTALYQQHDREFQEFFKARLKPFHRADDAPDLAQRTWEKATKHYARTAARTPDFNPEPWLWRIARNVYKDYVSLRYTQRERPFTHAFPSADLHTYHLEDRHNDPIGRADTHADLAAIFQRAWATATQTERKYLRVVLWVHKNAPTGCWTRGDSAAPREVGARTFGTTPGTLKSWYYRGLRILRKHATAGTL